MDNLGSHKANAVRRAIRAVGARLFYLPKYSSDLNPIEQFFAKFSTGYAKPHSEPPRLSTTLSLRSSTPSRLPNAPITSPTQDMTKPKLIPLRLNVEQPCAYSWRQTNRTCLGYQLHLVRRHGTVSSTEWTLLARLTSL